MSLGAVILSEAFEALGWPWQRVQRVAAWLLIASAVTFPVAFQKALTAYANREAQVLVHQLANALPQPPASTTPPSR